MKKILIFLIVISIFEACRTSTEIKILRPADVSTEGIKKVAVASFEVAGLRFSSYSERNGNWKMQSIPFSEKDKNKVSKLVRAKVTNLFNTVPYFQMVYVDKFAQLESDTDLQQMISAEGYKTNGIDAIISGKIWIEFNRFDSADIDVLKYIGTSIKIRRDSTEKDRILWYPYKSLRGSIIVETKLIRVNPSEVISVSVDKRTFAQKIEGNSNSLESHLDIANEILDVEEKEDVDDNEDDNLYLPPFEQVLADIANFVAASFADRVAVTQKTVNYRIAEDGDEASMLLIKSGAYKKAIEQLGDIISGTQKKLPADIYNLGLCYEAIGEYGIAMLTYEEAFKLENKNELIIAALGRVETKKQEQKILSHQLDK